MKTINKEYLLNIPIDKIWDALTNPKTIQVWTNDKAIMSEKPKDKFELWAGEIHGKNLKVVKNKTLVQEWFSKGWERPSKVTFNFSKKGKSTLVKLKHEDVPIEELEEFEKGWDTYYFNPIKDMFENWK